MPQSQDSSNWDNIPSVIAALPENKKEILSAILNSIEGTYFNSYRTIGSMDQTMNDIADFINIDPHSDEELKGIVKTIVYNLSNQSTTQDLNGFRDALKQFITDNGLEHKNATFPTQQPAQV